MAQSALLSRETSASSEDIRLDKSARFGAQHRRPAFEVSLRGQESAPLEDFNFLYNRFEEMLTLGAIM